MDRSKPLERRRQRRSHPKVRSTTQRRDMTTISLASLDLPMTSTVIGQFASLIVLPASSPHSSLPASTVDDGRVRVRTTPRPEPPERRKTGANLLQDPRPGPTRRNRSELS